MVLPYGGAGGSCSSREEHLPIEAPTAQRGELLLPAPSLSVLLPSTPPLAATALAWPIQRCVPLPPSCRDRMSPCRFLHTQCDQDLFTSEYLRSNKASGHKNLRCFPHCCGGHNPKSFCGSGLVVESAIPDCQLVLGRFEEVAKQKKSASTGVHVDDTDNSTSSNEGNSLVVGREYVRDELMAEVKVPEQPFGKWFRGTLVPVGVSSNTSNASSSRFLINGNRQSWHYGWQSSRLNCKNLHVFKVYFFSESANQGLVCEGALSSPAFRISSSRKARKTFRSPVLLSSMSVDGSNINSGDGGGSNGTLLPRGVPSIDELLDHQNPSSTSRHDVLGSIDPRLLPPSLANVNGHYYSSNGYSAVSAVDPARRERKRMTRLTRSGSLKSEYFTATSFQPGVHQQPTSVDMNSPMSLADSFVNQRLASTTARSPPLAPPHQSQLLPSVASLHAGTGNSSGSSRMHVRRSSLAALPMPTPTISSSGASRPMSILTPITGMMQLTLQTPRPSEGSVGSATVPPLSSFAPPPPPPPASSLPSSSLSYYERLQSRRESWSSGMALRQSLLQQQSLPPSIVIIPLSPSSHFPNRKRNRSTDSDKALFIGPGGPHDEPNALPLPVNSSSRDGLAQNEVDTDLYRRARILQLAYMIIKRIHRFDQVHKPAEAKVYRHSFEMVTPSGTARRPTATLVQIPLTNHQLLHLCSTLVAISHALLATKGFLQELRDHLMHCAQSGLDHHAAYAQVITFIDDAVREEIAQLPRRAQGPSMQQPDSPMRELYDILKSCEPWLLQEPWWCLHDDDDDDEEHEENGQQQRRLPYWRVFLDYYGAIESSLPSPRDLEVSAALRDAAISRSTGGLTGEWHRHIDADDLNKPLRMNGGGGVAPSSTTLSSSSLLPFASLSWVERMLYAQTTQLLNLTETATTMTLSLPNGPISPHSVFLLELDNPEPTVLGPQDIVFPFGWSRKKQLVAYRAWRVRDLNDQNGSAVAVQFMRWPDNSQVSSDENDFDEDEEDDVFEPEQEPEVSANLTRLRTRLTIYFGVGVETNRVLQVRTIVEGSTMGPGSPMSERGGNNVAPPTEADMVRYFKSPSSWELMAQVTQQYELV